MTTVSDVEVSFPGDHPIDRWAPGSLVDFRTRAKIMEPASGALGVTVFYAPGSSRTTPPDETRPDIAEFLSSGYRVVSLGWDVLPYNPYKYGYGSVHDPQHLHRWIRAAWQLHAVIDELSAGNYIVVGGSLGATAVLAWAANYHTPSTKLWQQSSCRGVIADGATLGGLGGNRWNDITRTMNELSQMVGLCEVPEKVLLTYGAQDDYFPPDAQNRLRSIVPAEMKMITVPNSNHSWFVTNPQGPSIVRTWIDQIRTGATITLADGTTPAKPGAKA